MASTPQFPAVLASAGVKFTNADTTVAKAIYTPTGTNGARVDAVMAAWDDTVAGVLSLYLRRGASNFLLGSVPLAARAGDLSTVPAVNVLANIGLVGAAPPPFIQDPYGNSILYLDATTALWARVQATMTAAKTLDVTTFAGEF